MPMNSKTTGLRIASLIFALVAIAHVIRLYNHAAITLGTHHIPMTVSWVALIVTVVLCIWMWRLSATGR
jgi:uncharacterized membrane protein YecN with MAPEG domain